jgi:lipopolysaccharide export system permease protein
MAIAMIPNSIDRYLIRQVFFATLFAVAILCGVLVLGNIFKQIRPLLVEKGLPLSVVGSLVVYLLPFTLVYTIPWGFLISVTMVFGRLSSDQEIAVMRGGGLSYYRIAAPVLVLAFLLSIFCLWLNGTQSPHSKARLKQIIYDVAKEDPMQFFEPGVVQSRIKDQILFVEERAGESSIKGLHIYQMEEKNGGVRAAAYIHAGEVDFDLSPDSKRFDLDLKNVHGETYGDDGQMQYFQAAEISPWTIPCFDKRPSEAKPENLDNARLSELIANPPNGLESEILDSFALERIRRYSFSLAPMALAFIAIPLSLQSRRKDSSVGLGMALIVSLAYFVLFIVAKDLGGNGTPFSFVLVWLPNIICLGLGAFLFRRAGLQG